MIGVLRQLFDEYALRYSRALLWLALLVPLLAVIYALSSGTPFRPGWIGGFVGLLVLCLLFVGWVKWKRQTAIRESALPQFLKRKLRQTYPHLTGSDCDLVERGFRQFFLACARSETRFVAMPSKVVDSFWHEFILHTRAYDLWCQRTLGRFLHHTPAEVLGPRPADNDGLRRAWFWSCREESINPRKPSRLPLLFALDRKLAVEGGFLYIPNCKAIAARSAAGRDDKGNVYCGGDFADGSYPGDADGMGGADAVADGSGDGGAADGGGGDGGDGGGCGGGD
jgi:hypothetical protein